jgi:hypothetical protein
MYDCLIVICYYYLIIHKFFLLVYQLFLVKQIIAHYCNFLKVKQEVYLVNFW